LARGHQLVATAVEPDDVDLEPVAQPRLGDAAVALEVVDEAEELDQEVVVDGVHVGGHQPPEEDAARPRRRLGRQPPLPQRHPPGRHGGARVPDLELGQEHPRTVDAWVPGPEAQVRRRSAAQRVSSWRLESCSLRSTAETWVSTVLTEISRRRAISL